MYDQVGAIEGGGEEPLVALELQSLRHHALGVRQHAVGRDDDIAVNPQWHERYPTDSEVWRAIGYSEIVCTTLETGRALTVGSLTSFWSSSSYDAMVCTGALAFICTTL